MGTHSLCLHCKDVKRGLRRGETMVLVLQDYLAMNPFTLLSVEVPPDVIRKIFNLVAACRETFSSH
jgi:hypothetical protein